MSLISRENIDLAQLTIFKIGGSARYFCEPENQEEVIEAANMAQKMGLPFFILGGGSNVLIADEGYDGVVIKVQSSKSKVQNYLFLLSRGAVGDEGSHLRSECLIQADAGFLLKDLVDYCAKNGLSSLEWAAGIPGTVGGAVRGNAGAYGGQMSDIIESVNIFCRGGALRPPSFEEEKNNGSRENEGREPVIKINQKDCQFSYRNSIFKQNPGLIILSVELKLQQGDKEEIKRKVEDILEKRTKSLGKCYPSAGCVFKNPQTENLELIKIFENDRGVKIRDNKIPAGYLIEKLGLKGARIGGAIVSKNNANFILNENNATARDVLDLVEMIKGKIKAEFGVELELEIQVVKTDFHG